jgi:large subunit ribosomal protein L9
MKIVLLESVAKMGKRGDIVEVSAGYFRNYLQPRGLAAEATPDNLTSLERRRRKEEKVALKEKDDASVAAGRLEEKTLKFTLKVGEDDRAFGSVTAADIAEKLREIGYDVDKKKVQLEEPIRKLGLYTVHVRLHPDVTAKAKLLVEKA